MSIHKGVFTDTAIQNVRMKLEALMLDNRVKLQYSPQIEAAAPLMANANLLLDSALNSRGRFKDLTVEVEWINACEVVDESCTNCTTGGNELSTNTKTYALDLCRQVPFTVKEYDMLTNDFDHEDLIAKGLLKADKEISEWIVTQWIAFLNTNKGRNVAAAAPGTARGCISGFDTYINAPYWNSELMGYFAKAQQLNRFTNPFLLSGANLFESVWNANANSGNANGKGEQAMFGSMPINFDIFNVDTVNSPSLISYLIQPGTYAIANKAYYEPTPITYDFGKRWSIKSQFLPGFEFDVHYSNVCENDKANHQFKVKSNSGIYINPEACDDENTGILTFVCGECP